MKLFLLKLTALALAAASAAQAVDDKSFDLLRGSFAALGRRNSCDNRSQREGRNAVRSVWRKIGEDCADTIGRGSRFQKEVRRMKDRDYPDTNWRNSRENRCIRDAIDQEVNQVEKECLHDNTDVCADLANFAASQIVDRYEPDECSRSFSSNSHGGKKPNWRKECRETAQEWCKGDTRSIFADRCGYNPNGTTARNMADECNSEVRKILRNGDAEYFMDYDTNAEYFMDYDANAEYFMDNDANE